MSDSIPKRRKMRPLNAIAVERANKVKLEDKSTNPISPILSEDTNEWAQNNKIVERDYMPQKSDDNHEKQGESMDITAEKDASKKKKQESAIDASDVMEIDTPVTQTSSNVSNELVKQKAKAKNVRNTDKEQNHTVRDKKDEAPNKKTEAKVDTKQDEKKKRKEEKRAVKHAEKEQKKMAEKIDSSMPKEEQKAKKRKEKHERKEKKKQQKMSMDGKRDSTTHQKSSNKTADKASTDITAETTKHKNGTISSQQYQSASDSDDTDNEKSTKSTTPTAPTKKKAPTFLQGLSDSDSDDTDKEKSAKTSTSKKPTKKKENPSVPVYLQGLFDSDSDDTDNEKARKPTKPIKPTTPVTKKAPAYQQELSHSDSDDTDNEKTRKPTKKKNVAPTHQQARDSSDEEPAKSAKEKGIDLTRKDNKPDIKTSTHIHDSDNEDDKSSSQKQYKMSDLSRLDSANYLTNLDALNNNRILSRYRKKFDETDSVATKLNNRFNADIVPTVEKDFFISDSDSATDSDDSYSHPSPHAWHNETGYYGKGGVPFPKGRKFGFTDRIKLEKRIKKICRRRGMSFDDFKEFTQENTRKNKSVWRMIAKVFPDRTLRQIAMYCEEAYSPHKEFGAVTKTDVQEFKRLVDLYGEKRSFLADKLGITVARVKHLLDIVRGRTLASNKSLDDNGEPTKRKSRWTVEEVALLLQEAKQNRRENGTVNYERVASAFGGKFTAIQIRSKYRNTEGLKIKKDGKLQKRSDISPVTVLEYFKCLLQQAYKLNLQDESQLEFRKGIDNPLAGYQGSSTYLKARLNIKGVEKMKVKEILTKLVERQERSVAVQREEGLLE